jgi:hypothetical protein
VRLCVLAAGKAFLCRAMARWIAEEGLWPDDAVGRAIASECIRLRLPVPCLVIEPGRPRRGARHRRYNHSMASNYDLVGLSPVIAVREGTARPLVRRDDQRPAGPGYRPLRRLFMEHKLLVPVRTTAAGNARPANRTAAFGRAHWPGVHLGSLPSPHSGSGPALDRPVLGRSA